MVPAKAGHGHPFISQPFLNHRRGRASHMQAGALFRPWMGHETNLQRDETIFRTREGRLKPALDISWLTKRRAAKAQ
jgi:hypothetical protein